MYRALRERDPSYEGVFFACVKTTGIFCRPTCRARKPRRENVEFLPTAADAIRAGYRPCRVCRPAHPDGAHPAWAAALMERLEETPGVRLTDAGLAQLGIEPARARRWFRRRFGVTFHGYQRGLRLGAATALLRSGQSIGAAAHRSGWESESGFREAYARLFGSPPGRGSNRDCLRARHLPTPLGPMIAIASSRGIALVEFEDRRALEAEIGDVRRHFGGRVVVPGSSNHLERLADELAEYFDGTLRDFSAPIDTPATPFERAVWQRLREIPYGATASYSGIAAELGRPGAARAVGRANGRNRVALVIPCHRVVREDGALCGYGGGLWRKRFLLDLEGAPLSAAVS